MGYLKGAKPLPNERCNAIRIKMTPLKLQLVVFSQQDEVTKHLYENRAQI